MRVVAVGRFDKSGVFPAGMEGERVRVLVEGKILENGMAEFKNAEGQDVKVFFVTLFQAGHGGRPGETCQVWTQEQLLVDHGEQVTIAGRVTVKDGRVKLSAATLEHSGLHSGVRL